MGTTAEKLAYLKETKNQIKQALETPYNVMRDYPALIKKYIDNQTTKVVSDGNCTNALDVPLVSLGIDGNSYQEENPSPENPQDIEVIDGVNINNGIYESVGISSTGGTYASSTISSTDYLNVKGFKNVAWNSKANNSNYSWGAFYTDTKTFISRINTTASTVSVPANAKYMRLSFLNEYKDILEINEGTTPKPYLPHGCIGLEHTNEDGSKSEVIPIDLQGNYISKVGDIKDLLKIYKNGDVEIKNKIGKVVLDGSEDIKDEWQQLEHVDYIQFYLSNSIFNGNFKDSKGKCNIFNTVFDTVWVREKECMAINSSTQYTLQFKFLRSRFANLDQFKQYLSDRYNAGIPVEVYYELAEPETIKLPSIEPIELWEGTNKFELITNLDTTFTTEYVINKNNILDEIQTAMLDA